MDKMFLENFKYVVSFTSPRIQMYLNKISENVVTNIQEIRLRANRPVVIVTHSGCSFLTNCGKLSYILSSNCVYINDNEISDSLNKMCGYSFHSHYEDILNGYVTLANGARVGLSGTAVFEKEFVKGIKDIDGLNIRIPRLAKGVSEEIFKNIFKDGVSNLIIVGSPSSGKTTMLKDLTYQLSSGRLGKYYKICVVDERKEIAYSKKDIELIGPNTDILFGFPKAKGISMAVRTLSPDVIICDEVGSSNEAKAIIDSLNSGVSFILTIHSKDIKELKRKVIYNSLTETCAFNNTVFLKSCNEPCVISKIYKNDEVVYEDNFSCVYSDSKPDNFNELYQAN